MSLRHILLHFRFPFSWLLMPVFMYAISQVLPSSYQLGQVLLLWSIWHIWVYPASNAFNSYFDKDEGSIGGLEHPPPVSVQLYRASVLWMFISLLLAACLGYRVLLGVGIYTLASVLYSHPYVRLKRYPWLGWVVVVFFQGAWVYMMIVWQLLGNQLVFSWKQHSFAALLSSCMLAGLYPLTQVYQHDEDRRRGDQTLSLILGVRATFRFAMLFFVLSAFGHVCYAILFADALYIMVVGGLLLPAMLYFVYWYRSVRRSGQINYHDVMRMSIWSATLLNAAFGTLYLLHYFG